MNPERWARIKEIFHATLEREEKERPEFVAKACGADEELCREIESLLREHSTAPPIVSPVRQPDLSGQIITHYRILKKLGQGGMGLVYKAEDLKLGRTVALKFLAPHVLASEEYRARFIQEAKALAAIDHPNICAVHEIDEAKGQIFFAMTFIDGPTLKEKIAGRPLDLREARNRRFSPAGWARVGTGTGAIGRYTNRGSWSRMPIVLSSTFSELGRRSPSAAGKFRGLHGRMDYRSRRMHAGCC